MLILPTEGRLPHYLGLLITPGKLAVATENTKAFKHLTFPRNATQVRSFLGAANLYRSFV